MNEATARATLFAADGPPLHDRLEAPSPDWRAVRRLLAVRGSNAVDLLLATPALRAIKQSLHGVHLTVLTSPDAVHMARLNPDIDDVIACRLPRYDSNTTFDRAAFREEMAIEAIRDGRFDGAIVLPVGGEEPTPIGYLCYVARVPCIEPPWPPDSSAREPVFPVAAIGVQEDGVHEVERCLDAVARIGLHADDTRLVLTVPHEDRLRAAEIIGELRTRFGLGPLVVMTPGDDIPSRGAIATVCAGVADLLIQRLQAVVILLSENAGASSLVQARMQEEATDLTASLPLSAVCALLKTADITVTGDVDIMHLSAAAGTPVVTLFAGGTRGQGWRAWGVPHRHLPGTAPKRVAGVVQTLLSNP